MKISKLGLLTPFSAVILSCAHTAAGQSITSVVLEESASIGEGPFGAVYQMADVTTDREDNVYITDMADNRIKKYDDHGCFVMEAGGYGKEDWQFDAIRLINCHERLLYLTDQFRPGIRVFRTDGTFETLIPFAQPVFDLFIENPERIWVESFDTQRWGTLTCINREGREVDQFHFATDKPSLSDIVSLTSRRGSLILAYKFKDLISYWDSDGRMKWKKSLHLPVEQSHQRLFGLDVPGKAVYKDIAVDTSGHLFILGGHFSAVRSRDVYVMNAEGESLATFTLPEPTHCLHIDHRNFLYTRAGQGSRLIKFRLHYH